MNKDSFRSALRVASSCVQEQMQYVAVNFTLRRMVVCFAVDTRPSPLKYTAGLFILVLLTKRVGRLRQKRANQAVKAQSSWPCCVVSIYGVGRLLQECRGALHRTKQVAEI